MFKIIWLLNRIVLGCSILRGTSIGAGLCKISIHFPYISHSTCYEFFDSDFPMPQSGCSTSIESTPIFVSIYICFLIPHWIPESSILSVRVLFLTSTLCLVLTSNTSFELNSYWVSLLLPTVLRYPSYSNSVSKYLSMAHT